MKWKSLKELNQAIEGEILTDDLHKIIYATDASVYREIPIGVCIPKHEEDLVKIVRYCHHYKVPIIPRAGGTSLAGQCVGGGLVVDISKHFTSILELDIKNKEVCVQPGVIRNNLNNFLAPHALLFGPNTSTANRAMIGGMVGNNSCGSTSIVYGNTRDHVTRLRCVLSDGSFAIFEALDVAAFEEKCKLDKLEGSIYRHFKDLLADEDLRREIIGQYPAASITRRNTGYALDKVLDVYEERKIEEKIDVCKLLCGSEGTLAFTTEITLGLLPSPADTEVLLAIHFQTIEESLSAVPLVMEFRPFACELMDKTILDCTGGHPIYNQDKYFIEGDPAGVLMVSFRGDTVEQSMADTVALADALNEKEYGYAFPIITKEIEKIWNLRKAGLGLLANLPGDRKAVACIEDTAVDINVLSDYIKEFTQMMTDYGQEAVYYAHAGAGELHLRPILDLKVEKDRTLFHDISLASARLVKKYNGSLSGEHGDGRVRAPFIQEMYGAQIYEAFKQLKSIFDPQNILNPGKIIDAAAITDDLRYGSDHKENRYETVFDFGAVGGVLRAAEKCNGSGDCRKTEEAGGTMCPSYMATRDEKDTTRARANTLREILTHPKSENAWNSEELKEVMDLCLSCKGCSSECPSNVDMSSMKAEFLHHYHKVNGVPLRSKIFSNFSTISSSSSKFSSLSNVLLGNKVTGTIAKKVIGIHPKRSFPKFSRNTLRTVYKRFSKAKSQSADSSKKVYIFCDEFTNYNDAEVGEAALKLLAGLGYHVVMVDHAESGRAAISKGLLSMAKKYAESNVKTFHKLINEDTPLIGLEPSAILSFRDEYPRIVEDSMKADAKNLAKHVYTIEEFLYDEIQRGNISSAAFDVKERNIKLHGHCHQKALTDIKKVAWVLSAPSGNQVSIIPSGCCGMAGSFGYEVEHYDVSMQIGELVLFPAVRAANPDTIIAASGTSCRHQILDGTKKKSFHPIQILAEALI